MSLPNSEGHICLGKSMNGFNNRFNKGVAGRAIAVAIAASSLIVGVGVGPAVAGTASGIHGPAGTVEPGVDCVASYYGSRVHSVTAFVRNPQIFGADLHPGAGNDWQWVRFRSRAIDEGTRQTLVTSGWSAFSAAYENRAAAYAGMQSVTLGRAGFDIQIDIEWWNQTKVIGRATLQVARYRAYFYPTITNGTAVWGC